MKNLNKIWGLIIVGVVMLVSCNTYDRSGVSDVGVPSGVTMEGMYDDISSVLSEVAENDEELKRYEELFGGIDFSDGNAIDLTMEQEEFIKNSTCYREMLGLLNKYFTEEDMLLVDGEKLEGYRLGLRRSKYVLRTEMREMDERTVLKSEKWVMSMLHAMKNYGYARCVGSQVRLRDSLGNEQIVGLSALGYRDNFRRRDSVALYEVSVDDLSQVSEEDVERSIGRGASYVGMVALEEYERMKTREAMRYGSDMSKRPLRLKSSDCQRDYDYAMEDAFNNLYFCLLKVAAPCAIAIKYLGPAAVKAAILGGTVGVAICGASYLYATNKAKSRYWDCMGRVDEVHTTTIKNSHLLF